VNAGIAATQRITPRRKKREVSRQGAKTQRFWIWEEEILGLVRNAAVGIAY